MAYNKAQPIAAGKALVALILAVKDGIDAEDADDLIAFVTALTVAADDIKLDTDAAVPHLISGITEAYGDSRIDPVVP